MKIKLHIICIDAVLIASFLHLCSAQSLSVTAKTKTYGGVNSGGDPEDNVAVIYIMTPDSHFINTCMVWGATGFDFMLKNWRLVSGIGKSGYYDGVTQATRDDHSEPLEVTWDCKDSTGAYIPPGTYDYWIEMNENDWWWQELDPNEVYKGKITKGTIEIDFLNESFDTGNAIENIFDIYAHFNPATDIKQDEFSKQTDKISFSYNSVTGLFYMNITPFFKHSGAVDIYNLQGILLRTISFGPATRRLCWDGTNSAGYTMLSGVYLFRLHTDDTPAKSSKFTATLYK